MASTTHLRSEHEIRNGNTSSFTDRHAGITGVAIDGNPIKLGQSFAANDSWLEKLTFRIKNVSSVKLSKVQMNLFLPEIMPGGPMVTFCYGCGPTLGRSISPGEEVEMKVVF